MGTLLFIPGGSDGGDGGEEANEANPGTCLITLVNTSLAWAMGPTLARFLLQKGAISRAKEPRTPTESPSPLVVDRQWNGFLVLHPASGLIFGAPRRRGRR